MALQSRHGTDVTTPMNELEVLDKLCQALGIGLDEALRELVAILEERRDLAALAHPAWRQMHRDAAFDRMERLYGSEERARAMYDAIDRLFARGGARVEAASARHAWRTRQLAGTTPEPRCAYCGIGLSTTNAAVDHRIPLARGGSDSEDNWQLVCADCNGGKSAMLESQLLSPWHTVGLFSELVVKGKTTLSRAERFYMLWRARFACARCEPGSATRAPLRIFFRRKPGDGGQATPENLVVLCISHVRPEDQECL